MSNAFPSVAPVSTERRHLIRYINLKLITLGQPHYEDASREFTHLTDGLLRNLREKNRILSDHLCPADQRIQDFLDDYLADVELNGEVRLPNDTFVLDKPGLARELSVPVDGNVFKSDITESYRVAQGVLHNPKHDRRTTKGSFHVARGGLPIPLDKKSVPKRVFGNLMVAAFNTPRNHLILPYLANAPKPAEAMVSLYLRPLVCPAVPGQSKEKRMEIRFFIPGELAANLDFVETIFGNAGDPFLSENDAALDVDGWTGTTGCVILAPQLLQCKKKDLGLPHIDDATERQKREGMCWRLEDECYNDGTAFKITARTDAGVIVTLIADNYFGYCKKEVKTQIGYSANLFGQAEEEHAGGAIAFARYNLGTNFKVDSRIPTKGHTYQEIVKLYPDIMEEQAEGYAVDRRHSDILYVPEDVEIDLNEQSVTWTQEGKAQRLHLLENHTYVLPSGYQVHMERHPGAPSWRLIGTVPEGTFCHKPCTVSGGGKSEISKSLNDSIIFGPFFVADLEKDLDWVEEIFNRDYSDRFREIWKDKKEPSRTILSAKRSLGSVIKLLTPSDTEYNDEYNAWLESIPDYIKALVFVIKRFHTPDMKNWREHFTANIINGAPGHELKYDGRALVASYLRIGHQDNSMWRTYKLRQDFIPAAKVQMEDDITASITVQTDGFEYLNDSTKSRPSFKIAQNCENYLFQRPDDAVHRGFDKQAERDISSSGNFLVNWEPIEQPRVHDFIRDAVGFNQFTEPVRRRLKDIADNGNEDDWFVSTAHSRIFDGRPTKNPRYLQFRPDLEKPRETYLANVGTRLFRRVPADKEVIYPVDAVLAGRRNNPPDKAAGIRPLAVYNPIHYQELPELFMDFVCSLTGKSPSTTGAGSEGALTKGPFNALPATSDLNNALVSFILTGYDGFSTAAGFVGPNYRVDHDISLLIPEIWCRLSAQERNAENLIKLGCLEKLEDFDFNGETILQSRLGYRMTKEFLRIYFGRLFDSPMTVFNEEMLKPETQDMEAYVDGIKNITEAQERVATYYLEDGSEAAACPPLRALLHIMAKGDFEGKTAQDPDVRKLFTRESLLASDWYKERLENKRNRDVSLMKRKIASLEAFLTHQEYSDEIDRLGIRERLKDANRQLTKLSGAKYAASLKGTIGADPLYRE